MQTYEQINAGFNRQMLGGQQDRVKFLRRILTCLKNPTSDLRLSILRGQTEKARLGQC